MLERYDDLIRVRDKTRLLIEFVVFASKDREPGPPRVYNSNYMTYHLSAADNMRDFRDRFKRTFRVPYLGHVYILSVRRPQYKMLKEWLINDVSDVGKHVANTLSYDAPHVVVYDMDSTLITEEEEVRIRDPAIYDRLQELCTMNVVLVLWSYGDREHVIESMQKLDLMKYFTKVLSEGNRNEGHGSVSLQTDKKYDTTYQSVPFHVSVQGKYLPKSPRVVLWYLQRAGYQFVRTIQLVDDCLENDYNYDNFVHISRCPEPVADWDVWHRQVLEFIRDDEAKYGR